MPAPFEGKGQQTNIAFKSSDFFEKPTFCAAKISICAIRRSVRKRPTAVRQPSDKADEKGAGIWCKGFWVAGLLSNFLVCKITAIFAGVKKKQL